MMRTTSDKVFLQRTIGPGSVYLPEPLEFAIFIKSWGKCASFGTVQILKGNLSQVQAQKQ